MPPTSPRAARAAPDDAATDDGEDLAGRLARLRDAGLTDIRPTGGRGGVRHFRARDAAGRELFVKAAATAPAAAELTAEGLGLAWLAEARAVPIPDIVYSENGSLALLALAPGQPDRGSAERFGRDLAATHSAGAERFGSAWPGWIAGLPLPDAGAMTWPEWYAQARLAPFARRARDAGDLDAADLTVLEAVAGRIGDLAGPEEPPSRIHGDCWSGNVLWSGGSAWLIDPAAHGGHRETDLAMLALFGAPHLDRILAAYREVAPLADGWQARAPLHQLHPLLVHVCLFGRSYREAVLSAARAVLS